MKSPNQATEFYDTFATKLLRDFVWGNPRTEAAILFACEQLRKSGSRSAIDIGFGLGWSTFECARALPGAELLGLDLSPRLAKLAAELFGDRPGLNYLSQDITALAWRAKCARQYDACVMLDVYEHVPRKERHAFHQSLHPLLADDGILVLTCPTPLHQRFLREHHPEGIQPVDEDVGFEDLVKLAEDLNGTITHLEHKSIWCTNDYFHATISRELVRTELPRPSKPHALIGTDERLMRLEKARSVLGRRAVSEVRGSAPSLACRLIRRLTRS